METPWKDVAESALYGKVRVLSLEISKEGLGGLSGRFPGLTAEYYREPYREVTLSVSVPRCVITPRTELNRACPLRLGTLKKKRSIRRSTHTRTHARTYSRTQTHMHACTCTHANAQNSRGTYAHRDRQTDRQRQRRRTRTRRKKEIATQ